MNFERTTFEEQNKGKIKEKIKKMIVTFVAVGIFTLGHPADFKFLKIFNSAENYKEYVQKNQELDEFKEADFAKKINYLTSEYSEQIFSILLTADKNAKKSKEKMPNNPVVEGFEKINISTEEVTELFSEKYYPRGTINGNISSISYIGESKNAPKDYNIESKLAGEAEFITNKINFYSNGSEINNGKDFKNRISSIEWHFSHELGHINDWMKNKNLSPLERVNFLFEVTNAYKKPGSCRDVLGYINSINNPNKEKEMLIKVAEYWATLCEYYLTFPDDIKNFLSNDEINLVKKWLERKDNNYKPEAAKKDREQFINNLAERVELK